jgi:membrane fusion protein (multidrug efflux system)
LALYAAPFLMALLVAQPARAQDPSGEMPPTPVEASKPIIGTVADTLNAVGTLRAAESVTIRPELAGRVQTVHFQEGERVVAGAPLFTLDASLVRAEVNEWQANVAQSKREADRANDLVARKLAAQNELDAKRAALAVNEARLSSARTRLGKTTLTAPFAGLMGLRMVSPGEYVDVGQELVSLTQTDPIKLDFRVPEIYAGRVGAEQPVEITVDAYPGQLFAGMVYAVDPQLDTAGRSVVLRARIDNPEGRLRPGMFARVSLTLGRRENALSIPEQALWPMGERQFVYIIQDGKAALSEITTGLRREGMVEVLTGLSADSMVITAGQIKIGPGSAVAALPPAGAPAQTPPPQN